MVTFVTKGDAIAGKCPEASAIIATTLILHGMQQFGHRPDGIRDSGCHGRRFLQCLVNAAEVVVAEVQRNGCLQVFDLLAERICKPRESPAHHAKRQVLPLDIVGADMPLSGSSQITLDTASVNRGGA